MDALHNAIHAGPQQRSLNVIKLGAYFNNAACYQKALRKKQYESYIIQNNPILI
jgi:hypothetical protein